LAKNRDVLPSAEIIAKFDTYEAAVEHVEKLLSGEFPVRQIAIVGRGVRTVERMRGRIGYPRIALSGAINGSLIGLVWHIFTSGANDAGSYASAIITFAGMGAMANLIRFSLSRNKRSFTAQSSLIADSYEIQIPKDLKAQSEDAIAKANSKIKKA
jgi:hypothetical protein